MSKFLLLKRCVYHVKCLGPACIVLSTLCHGIAIVCYVASCVRMSVEPLCYKIVTSV